MLRTGGIVGGAVVVEGPGVEVTVGTTVGEFPGRAGQMHPDITTIISMIRGNSRLFSIIIVHRHIQVISYSTIDMAYKTIDNHICLCRPTNNSITFLYKYYY
jgi:hypothetical protein